MVESCSTDYQCQRCEYKHLTVQHVSVLRITEDNQST